MSKHSLWFSICETIPTKHSPALCGNAEATLFPRLHNQRGLREWCMCVFQAVFKVYTEFRVGGTFHLPSWMDDTFGGRVNAVTQNWDSVSCGVKDMNSRASWPATKPGLHTLSRPHFPHLHSGNNNNSCSLDRCED